jgi:N-acetylglucosamine malate deacetylase 1
MKEQKNILAIGAHFDDIELGCGGSVTKHVASKDKVFMLVVTNSEYRNYDGKLLWRKELALKEGKKAVSILGVELDNLILFNYEAKKVPYSVDLIEKINEIIDNFKIDTIYTHWIYDVHQDHSAIGRATLNAARHVPRVLMYRSNWYSSGTPFRNNFFIDTSLYIETKIKAIRAYETECKKRGEKWIEFVRHQNRNNGIEMETQYAEAFEVVKYLQ